MIHRYLDVSRFNGRGDQGMRTGTNYQGVAEQLNIHVDILKDADDYVHYHRLKYLAAAVEELLAPDPELEGDEYHPMIETAFLGTYTVQADIAISGCSGDKGLQEQAIKAGNRLAALVRPVAAGFKVGRVRYECERLGTRGRLDFGLMWISATGEMRVMPPCEGLRGTETARETTHWCDRAWNDSKRVAG